MNDRIGFIGFGNMGGTMLTALLKFGALSEDQVIVFTRTVEKLKAFIAAYPRVAIAGSLRDISLNCRRVFICTGTKEVKPVLSELVSGKSTIDHVIYIAGTIEMKCIESVFLGKITHLMPTMISEAGEGVTLVCHNRCVQPSDKEFIQKAFGKIGRVREITDSQFDLAADLTSCAPAFYAAILNNLVEASRKHGDFIYEELKALILPTCYGTAKLLLENQSDFDSLISRVATKGGITEEGIRILNSQLPQTFDELLTTTLYKRLKVKAAMRQQFGLE